MTDAPRIRAVHAGEGRKLVVTWEEGAESIVDVGGYLAGFFAPLRTNDALFRGVTVGESGWVCPLVRRDRGYSDTTGSWPVSGRRDVVATFYQSFRQLSLFLPIV